jgi:hypothetical protein
MPRALGAEQVAYTSRKSVKSMHDHHVEPPLGASAISRSSCGPLFLGAGDRKVVPAPAQNSEKALNVNAKKS